MVASTAKLELWLALIKAPGLGPVRIKSMLDYFGSIESIFQQSKAALQALGLKSATIHALLSPPLKEIEEEIIWSEQKGQAILIWDDDRYPELLKHIPASPPAIYVKGLIDHLQHKQIAIVGSRKASHHSLETAVQLASGLSRHGLVVTSGLALGIDAASHRGALQAQGKTIAVLGSGLSHIYPIKNKRLAEEIIDNGVLVSEHALNARPLPYHFPRRNRIISGLSLGVIVVAATCNSGSLITVAHALEQGKDVFAVPGAIGSLSARGCHHIIRQGAELIENAEDVVLSLNIGSNQQSGVDHNVCPDGLAKKATEYDLDSNQYKLLECVDYKTTTLDCIIGRSKQDVTSVGAMLLILECKGYVSRIAGGYIRER
jgi:DNA processing protein